MQAWCQRLTVSIERFHSLHVQYNVHCHLYPHQHATHEFWCYMYVYRQCAPPPTSTATCGLTHQVRDSGLVDVEDEARRPLVTWHDEKLTQQTGQWVSEREEELIKRGEKKKLYFHVVQAIHTCIHTCCTYMYHTCNMTIHAISKSTIMHFLTLFYGKRGKVNGERKGDAWC